MLISFKTISQETFQVDVDPGDTIKVVKEKVEKAKGVKAYPADQQKMIFAGKILTDDQTVAELKLDEKKFIVIMVSQTKKPGAVAAATTSSAATVPAKSTTAAVKTPEPAPGTEKSPVSSGTSAPCGPSQSVATGGPEYERFVTEIMNMGYSRQQVMMAMEASNNNPDRAAGFLLASIPENLAQQQSEPQPVPAPKAAQAPPHAAVLQISPAEREAIDRLKAMGFPEDMAVQAYYACDKNENVAVNLLLQQTEHDNP